jgi:flagellar biosynthesis/type III secretory pathway chaperone
MEPQAACRRELGAILAEEEAALGELASFLDREHAHLAANEVGALESVIRDRQRAIGRVVRADEQRAALCRQLGHTPDARGIAEVLRGCDTDGSLASVWGRCRAAALSCRALNDRNSALASARLRHVQARLAALFTGRGEAVAYGPRGTYALASVGRVVKVDV